MSEKDDDAIDRIMGSVFSGEALNVIDRHIEFKTPSGRKFRYELSEFPIGGGTTPEGALALAKRIFHEKYRYCEWDRNHPDVDVDREITDKIVECILMVAEAIRRSEARKPRVFVSWAIFSGEQLVEEFPYPERDKAQRRLGELLADKPGGFELHQIRRMRSAEENAESGVATNRPSAELRT